MNQDWHPALRKLGLGYTLVFSCWTLGLCLCRLEEPSKVRARIDFNFCMLVSSTFNIVLTCERIKPAWFYPM